jgi:hypothetical protein
VRWSWSGAVALVLATCVGVGWAVAVIVAVLEPGPVSSDGGPLLHTLGGALAGGVVAWLSGERRRHRDDDDEP